VLASLPLAEYDKSAGREVKSSSGTNAKDGRYLLVFKERPYCYRCEKVDDGSYRACSDKSGELPKYRLFPGVGKAEPAVEEEVPHYR